MLTRQHSSDKVRRTQRFCVYSTRDTLNYIRSQERRRAYMQEARSSGECNTGATAMSARIAETGKTCVYRTILAFRKRRRIRAPRAWHYGMRNNDASVIPFTCERALLRVTKCVLWNIIHSFIASTALASVLLPVCPMFTMLFLFLFPLSKTHWFTCPAISPVPLTKHYTRHGCVH